MVRMSRAGRRGFSGALSLIVFSGLAHGLYAQAEAPFVENRLVREELKLARTPSLYFVIYLKTGKIFLKSRGMILREWEVLSYHVWGGPLSAEAVTLRKKSTLFPPKRTKIKPAESEEEAAVFEPDALELRDMPSRFSLFLTNGTRVYVRPKAKGFFPRLGNIGHLFAWYVWAPLTNLTFELRKRPFAAFEIVLPQKEDVQALYWAFPDGIKGLIYPL